MDVPFNITKYENDVFIGEVNRFLELYPLFEDHLEEALEFAKLYHMLVRTKRIKYR